MNARHANAATAEDVRGRPLAVVIVFFMVIFIYRGSESISL